MSTRARALAGVGVALFSSFASPAGAQDDEGDVWPSAGGSFRTISGAQVDPDVDAEHLSGLSENWLRLTLEGPLECDAREIQVHAVQHFSYGPALGPVAPNAPARFRVLREDRTWFPSDDSLAYATIDRANFRGSMGPLDVTVGRQAINLATMYLYSPLDIYRAFQPWVFDRDYKPSVDAAKVAVSLGDFSGMELIGAAGRTLSIDETGSVAASEDWFEASPYGSSVLARGFTSIGSFDLTAQVGKTYGGFHWGLGAALVTDTITVRVEGAATLAEPVEPSLLANPQLADTNSNLVINHVSGAIGIERTFDNGLSLLAEYYYNGAGEPDDLGLAGARVLTGEMQAMNRHLAGLYAKYDITDLTELSAMVLSAPEDPSALASLIATHSIADDSEILVGAFAGFGEPPLTEPVPSVQSEFGGFEYLGFAEWKLYF